jgi:hypothetical protein
LDTLELPATEEEMWDMDYDKYFKFNLIEFSKDSLKIAEILKEYNAVIVTPVERTGSSSTLQFKVGRRNSIDNFECYYYAYPDKVKSIDIVEMWDAKGID